MEDMMDDMFGGERYWQDGPDDDGDAEVAALRDGQLQMDRALQTLQEEIAKRADCQARAEAAENELGIMRGHAAEVVKIRDLRIAELESQLAALVTGPGGFNERADIIKELKAQLAAQAWRPVTEPPQMADSYHVWRRPGYHDFCHFDGVNWRTTGGDSVTHWQPLPAPPIDPLDLA